MCSIDQFPALFVEFRHRLHAHARNLLGAQDFEADDVVQAAFLKGYLHLDRGNPIRDPYRFLCKTVTNLVMDNYRFVRVRESASLVGSSDREPIETSDVAPGNSVSSVERNAMSERDFETLCQAIYRLPKRARQVFILKYVYGYRYAEIAVSLSISESTAKNHGARALKRVKAALDRDARPRGLGIRPRRARRLLATVPASDHE